MEICMQITFEIKEYVHFIFLSSTYKLSNLKVYL